MASSPQVLLLLSGWVAEVEPRRALCRLVISRRLVSLVEFEGVQSTRDFVHASAMDAPGCNWSSRGPPVVVSHYSGSAPWRRSPNRWGVSPLTPGEFFFLFVLVFLSSSWARTLARRVPLRLVRFDRRSLESSGAFEGIHPFRTGGVRIIQALVSAYVGCWGRRRTGMIVLGSRFHCFLAGA